MTRASESAMARKAAIVRSSGSPGPAPTNVRLPGPAPTNVRLPRLGCGGAARRIVAVLIGRGGVQEVVTATKARSRSIVTSVRRTAAVAKKLLFCCSGHADSSRRSFLVALAALRCLKRDADL